MPWANTTTAVRAWLADCARLAEMRVQTVTWADCRGWRMRDGRLEHASGGFFSVVGVELSASGGQTLLMDQPEIGILGFVVRKVAGRKEWLVQAKAEPGNENDVQLAPAVQATESNYRRLHGGAPTRYLSWFREQQKRATTLSDSLQSEQGTRFLRKRNRNVVIEIDERADVPAAAPWWRWLPAACLRELLLVDYAVNTDARSVLVSGPWSALSDNSTPFRDAAGRSAFGAALWRSAQATEAQAPKRLEIVRADLEAARRHVVHPRIVALDQVRTWDLTADVFIERSPLPIAIRPYHVAVRGREVPEWCQPLFSQAGVLDIVLACRMRAEQLLFLFRPRAEPGLYHGVELGSSWCSDDRGEQARIGRWLHAEKGATAHCRVMQTDEGGRFFRAHARYRIVEIDPHAQIPEHDDFVWLTLRQVQQLCAESGVFANEARSLISLLLAYA